jgi:hypothetical protein
MCKVGKLLCLRTFCEGAGIYEFERKRKVSIPSRGREIFSSGKIFVTTKNLHAQHSFLNIEGVENFGECCRFVQGILNLE